MNPPSTLIAWDPNTQTYYDPSTGNDLMLSDAQITALIFQQHAQGFSVWGVDNNASQDTSRHIGTVMVSFSRSSNWLLFAALLGLGYLLLREEKP